MIRSWSSPDHPQHLIVVDPEDSDVIILRNFQFWLRSKHVLCIDIPT